MSPTTWKVIDTRTGEVLETHGDPKSANRACLIVSAHEIRNGRTACYTVEPISIIPFTMEELDLPDWAIEAIMGAGSESQA